MMGWYVVYRHGRCTPGQAAQGLAEKMAVARVRAGSEEEACRQAAAVMPACNHRLTAEPAEEVDAHEAALNLTARA